jgi:hypothetical protein
MFSDGLGIGFGGQFGHTDTVGNEALVHCNPGVQFAKGLLEMYVDTVIEDVAVLTEDEGFKSIEGSDGALGLVLTGLAAGFARVAMAVLVAGGPKVVDTDPHGTEEFDWPLALFVVHDEMISMAVLLL